MAPTEKNLDKGDLFLLMESYKNMIDLNRTILEQQKQTIMQINTLLESQKTLCDNVSKTFVSLDKSTEQFKQTLDEQKEMNKSIIEAIKGIASNGEKRDAEDKISNLKILNKINLVYVGLGALIIPLIVMVTQAFAKYELITKIAKKLMVEP